MEWILIGVAVVVGIVVVRAMGKNSVYFDVAQKATEGLNEIELKELHDRAFAIASRYFDKHPMAPTSAGEFDLHLEIAIRCQDRLDALQGLPSGTGNRTKLRFDYLKRLKQMGDYS